jgi:hypothetical protein
MRTFVAAAAALLVSACSAPERAPAPGADVADRAVLPGFGPIRAWSDRLDDGFLAEVKRAASREDELRRARGETGPLPPADYLAISGGGANGAFGAGLLNGWTEAGTRPDFKVVTGVSTGALIAPFAFLGGRHDATLRTFYTTIDTDDVVRERDILTAFFGDSVVDSQPLSRLIARVVTPELLQEIAAEYDRGRLLLVGTTNLDTQRGMIWNVTAIAASGHPDALKLIRRILLASASIPVAFPPLMIDVEVDGRRYQEMHVDGGALSQVFFYPPSLHMTAEGTGITRERRLWVIRNGRLGPQWSQVERNTFAIASRSIDSLILSQGAGDLYRIYLTCMRDDIAFNLACIPDEFQDVPREPFDRVVMTKLFELGRAAAASPDTWKKSPPGFTLPETRGGLTPAPESTPSK